MFFLFFFMTVFTFPNDTLRNVTFHISFQYNEKSNNPTIFQYNDNSKCDISQFTLFYMSDFNSYKLFLLDISKLILFYMSNFNSHKLFLPE